VETSALVPFMTFPSVVPWGSPLDTLHP
jgi:hypothetical protein